MKSIICSLLSFFFLSLASTASAQLPPEMRAKYTDEEYKAIMSKYHFHFRYDIYPAVDKPVKRGQVKLGHEYYDRWQGPGGWYYCAKDGECFDRKGLGVNPTGSCWVDSYGQCTASERKRDVSMFAPYFRVRGDLGPPMTLTGKIPNQQSTAGSAPAVAPLASWIDVSRIALPLTCFGFIVHF